MKQIDIFLFSWIAGGFHPNAVVLSIATAFAEGGAWAAAFVLAGAAWFHPRARLHLFGAVIASCLAALLSHALASAIGWPRPFALGLSPAWIAHGSSGTFPSTHAAVMVAVACICLLRDDLKIQAFAIFALALLTGWGRVYTGIHFPSDIAAGILMGMVLAGVFMAAQRGLHGLAIALPNTRQALAAASAFNANAHRRVLGPEPDQPAARGGHSTDKSHWHSPASMSDLPPDMQRPRESISCVIPCFNEGGNLDALLTRLKDAIEGVGCNWEVVVIDDGSTDDTAAIAKAWSELSGFRMISLSRNFGKEAAMTAGLRAARGDAVVILDGDMQHTPSLIGSMVTRWRAGADMVYAVRNDRAESGTGRELASRLFYRLVNTSSRYTLPRDAGDFRLMDRRVVDALVALPERTRFMKGLYAWVGFESVAIEYTPVPRLTGRSTYGGFRLLAMALDGLTAFTTWPLRAVSIVGVVLAICAFAYGTYLVLAHLISGNAVSGWTTIVVSLMFFAGIQLISTGILGEYIGRIFDEVKGRPLYVVRSEAGTGLEESL